MTLTITCPICGERSGYEFRFGGEDRGPQPAWENPTPKDWYGYVHSRRNIGGVQKEWWYHRDGCGRWFTIERDTLLNRQVVSPAETSRGDAE